MKESLKIIEGGDGDEIISVNNRARLKDIKKQYPNLEIIIGKVEETDMPVALDLAEMEASKIQIFDAATETILGKRIDILEKPGQFPTNFIVSILSFMAGVATTFFVYNI